MYKKLISGIAIASLLFFPAVTAAQTPDVLTSLQSLLQEITKLKNTLTASAASAGLSDDYGTGDTRYCPKLYTTLQRGSTDARTSGQVTELQLFLANHYDLDENTSVSGYFGAVTARNVIRFQQEQGLPALGIAGGLTRAAIARVCGSSGGGNTPATVTTVPPTSVYQPTVPSYQAPTQNSTTPAPIIYSFTASQSSVYAGNSVVLSWSSNADNCDVLRNESNGGRTMIASMVGSATTYTLSPASSGTYVLVCKKMTLSNGKDFPTAEKSIYITVLPNPAPTCTLAPTSYTASPYSYGAGYIYIKPQTPVTFSYSTTNAYYAVVQGGKGDISGQFTTDNLVDVTNTFTITAVGPAGETKCTAVIYVDYKG